MLGFEATHYFANLMAALLLLAPLFYALPGARAQKLLLVAAGLYLLALVAPRLALAHAAFWLGIAAAQPLLARVPDGAPRRTLFVGCLAAALAPMLAWKLAPVPFTETFNVFGHELLWRGVRALGELDAVKDVAIPVGLSFAAFRAVDLLVKTQIRTLPGLAPLDVLAYGLFPAVLVVGPVAEYDEVAFDKPRRFVAADLVAGLRRVTVGMLKIYVLAFPLRGSAGAFAHFDTNAAGVLWIELFLFTWYFYLNFSGFTDLALGCARVLGFSLRGNFDRPFLKPNPQRFWSSWHMSLTRFAQRNVFVPAGGYRPRTRVAATLATMLVIALWHDLSVPMLVFGLYHATGLLLHRWWEERERRRPGRAPRAGGVRPLGTAGTYAFVALSFPLLVLPAPLLIPYYAALMGLHVGV